MDERLEDRFLSDKRWEKKKECLNMMDMNLPPSYYKENEEGWINDLTTFISLHPKEWKGILEEYEEQCTRRGIKNYKELMYYRDDEGYLRKCGERDIYLRIHFAEIQEPSHLIKMAKAVIERWGFSEYENYCFLSKEGRREYLYSLKKEIVELVKLPSKQIIVSYQQDYENSSFQNRDIYLDQLNHTFTIL